MTRAKKRWWLRGVRAFSAFAVGVVAFVAGATAVASYGSDHGWWSTLWDRWGIAWGSLVAVLGAWFLVSASLPWLGADKSRRSRGRYVLGTSVVVAVCVVALRYPRVTGSFAVGLAAGTVALVLWLSVWLGARRTKGEARTEALGNGLCDLGAPVVRALRGPQGPRRKPVAPARAMIAGVLVLVVLWVSTVALAAVVAHRVVAVVRPDHREGAASPGVSASRAGGSRSGGNLRCDYEVGEGESIPTSLQTAIGVTVPPIAKRFNLCPIGRMTWEPTTSVYRQPIYTDDGDGAVLVAWERDRDWVVTFVASDDAAAYEIVSPTLDWRVLGRPHPFVACLDVFAQAFEGPAGVLVGVGIRGHSDVEGRQDRPVYAWGAAVEALLKEPPHRLRVPAGSPTNDPVGPLQYFHDRAPPLRTPHASAVALTVDDLFAACGA